MAAVTAAVVTAAGTAYAANRQGKAAEEAADAQRRAAGDANAEARRQFDLSREDNMPWMLAGQDALARQQAFLDGDWSGFENSPAYAYARDQMQQGIERGAAARGGLYNGGTNVDLANALNGIALQNSNTYWNQLAGLSNAGQNSAQFLGGLGSNFSQQFGQNTLLAGQAQAAGALARGQTQAGYANALGAGLGAYFGARQPATQLQPAATDWGAFAPTMNTGGNANTNWLTGLGSGLNYASNGGGGW